MDPNPFLDAAKAGVCDTALPEFTVREDVSDGLSVFRRSSFSRLFCSGYTRPDCRCGGCPASDPEPCPYALPARSSLSWSSSVLTAGRRSLSRILSVRDSRKVT